MAYELVKRLEEFGETRGLEGEYGVGEQSSTS